MHKMLRTTGHACALLFAASSLMAQVATGLYAHGTFDNYGLDSINVANLNTHLTIPILNKTGRGAPFSYSLSFDSAVWTPVSVNGISQWQPASNWGWNGLNPAGNVYVGYTMSTSSGTCGQYGQGSWQSWTYSNVFYSDQQGLVHPFNTGGSYINSTGGTACPPSGANPPIVVPATAEDGSGFVANTSIYAGYITVSLISPQGTTISASAIANPTGQTGNYSLTDANGNVTSFSGGIFTDTLGQQALTIFGDPPSATTISYKDTGGTWRPVSVTYKTYTVQTNFGCSTHEYGPTSNSLVDTIAFSDGSSYHFSYETTPGAPANVTGRISGVEVPQGGWIDYSYTGGNNGIICSDGGAAGLTRTLASDSGSAGSTWTYARTTPNGTGTTHTEVVDGAKNHKAYDFVAPSGYLTFYETARSVYQGAKTGTPVLARNTCYNGAASPCTTTTPSLRISQVDTYETLNGIQTHGATAKYSTSGMQTEADVYDFGGSTSRGALLRKEVWIYGSSISSLVSEDDVYDGSGNWAGKTLYGYDGGALTVSSGVPKHVAVSGARGNLTSATLYASSGTSYALSAAYEDTGTLLTSTTPTGTTTLTYDPAFVYNTGTTLPTPSSGVALGTGESYDTANTGLPLSSTDSNTQITKIPTYDSMLRPKEVDYPDGGKITLSYSPTQLGQQNSISGDTEVQYDGYGRQSRVEVANGQSGSAWYQVDTCYDANGNATFNSYLYQGDGFNASKVCSGSGDTYIYDVLGRLTSAVRADGETQGYTYLGRSTESVDANGVTRISQVDGLGRTAIVCEVSSGANLLPSGTTAASCGTDITGTGFTTTYNYTLATGTTTITQGAQTRTFVSDWLGRTTSNTEPERGTTNYNYQYNSTGLVVTRTRPKANQTSATVLTTTTTQFDALGRVLTISYDDGITPTKTFAYDAAAGADFTDLSQVNLKSRLSVVSVANAGTAFSYDPMGRTSALDECLPSGPCGATGNNHQLLYTYDLAGNMLTSTDGSGTKSTFTVSPASEPLSLTSSLGNSTNPANIVSNVQNGPNGPVNYGLGNGLAGVFHYDTLGRLNGGWVCSGSTGASCSSGTQLYGFTNTWKQQQLSCSSDTALNQGSSYGYDGFNRLTSLTVNSGSGSNYSWDYDRWGNRWQQNVLSGTGWPSSLSFNIASNRISVNGYSYDAVGNMTQDGFHSYTHDAEGNITAVDAGGTATYVYNALNQRVRAVVGGTITEYVFNAAGERASEWNGTTLAQLKGKYYLGTTPVAYYSGGATHFEHQDWLGTERMRTSYNGSVEGTFTSLPWGDGQSSTGADSDAYHFAMLDHDSESDTDHAQFRQYSNRQGNWLSPDPYSGSYDISNPQSFNRYVYALNNPLSNLDPSGLDCTSGDNYGFDLGIPDSVSFDGCPDSGALIRMYGWAPYPTDLNSISASYIGQQLNTLPSYSGVNFSGSPISFDGGGGGGGAPNNGTPWYKNSCVTSALAKGAASAGIDAIGLLPEGGVVSAALSGFHGAAGVSNGTNILQRVQMGAGLIGTANSASGSNVFAGLQAGVGVVGIAKALGAAIPVAGQVIAGVSVGLDIVGTGMEIANCH